MDYTFAEIRELSNNGPAFLKEERPTYEPVLDQTLGWLPKGAQVDDDSIHCYPGVGVAILSGTVCLFPVLRAGIPRSTAVISFWGQGRRV